MNQICNLSCILKSALNDFKYLIEDCIKNACFFNTKEELKSCSNGHTALSALIRSQRPINIIHEAIKQSFVCYGINPYSIHPPLASSSGELNITGKIKSKKQDICITPFHIEKKPTDYPTYMGLETDPFGDDFIRATLVMNVRSQIVSIAKNTDTILERTFAEPINLNLRYNDIVLGEFFLLPIKEIDIENVRSNLVAYKPLTRNVIEKYIRFFSSLNKKESKKGNEALISYSECCLILVDLSTPNPKIYRSTEELIYDGIVSSNFDIEILNLYFDKVICSLYHRYIARF